MPEVDLLKAWGLLPAPYRDYCESSLGPFPPFALSLVPDSEAIPYAAGDADDTLHLLPFLMDRLKVLGLERCYAMDIAVLPMLHHMQQRGMLVDLPRLHRLKAKLEAQKETQLLLCRKLVGSKSFNPNSTHQVGKLLFGKLGLRHGRLTKKARIPTTDDKTLQTLAIRHRDKPKVVAIIKAILDYRETCKFLGTFVEGLEEFTDRPTSLIHPNIRATRVITGRISTFDPNMLAWPVRTEQGKELRKLIIARPGFELLSCDFSQIELRKMAHHSKDPRMIEAFRKGEDLHALTASLLFGVKLRDVTTEQRYVAKTLNFAIMYGIQAAALYEQLCMAGILRYSEADCEDLISEWFRVYSAVKEYLEDCAAEARANGYIREPLSGRIRFLPNIYLPDDRITGALRAEAERHAGNYPIQAGAATTIKRAMARLWAFRKRRATSIHFLLQIHDELLMEIPLDNRHFGATVRKIMEKDSPKFRVPIVTTAAYGPSWGELEKEKAA